MGFKNADEIVSPLGARHVLILSRDKSLSDTVNISTPPTTISMVNYYSMHGSYMEYYCHPDLTEHLGIQKLGARGITQMVSPVQINFMERYSGVLKRKRPYR